MTNEHLYIDHGQEIVSLMQEKGKSVPSYGIYLSILDPSLKVVIGY